MYVKIQDNYTNNFVTTQKGFSIRRGEIIEADMEDVECKSYIEQNILVIVKEDERIRLLEEAKFAEKRKEAESLESKKEEVKKVVERHDEKMSEKPKGITSTALFPREEAVKEVVNKSNNIEKALNVKKESEKVEEPKEDVPKEEDLDKADSDFIE